MPFEVKVIADSISPENIRLTTLELTYPRFIHSEFMTHRVFSRNASSSRAIPAKRMLEEIKQNPATPVYWGANQKGMQAGEELDPAMAHQLWLNAMQDAVGHAETMAELGLHKQIVNRITEPFAHIRVVVTATEWSNFFSLRRHKDAQPEIKHLADLMWDQMEGSEPNFLKPGQWHLPYIEPNDWERVTDLLEGYDEEARIYLLRKISTARCARVSYRTHDGKPTALDDDLALYERLVGSHPMHASPAEHQATPDKKADFNVCNLETMADWSETRWENEEHHGNFTGWIQFRKTLEGESQ